MVAGDVMTKEIIQPEWLKRPRGYSNGILVEGRILAVAADWMECRRGL